MLGTGTASVRVARHGLGLGYPNPNVYVLSEVLMISDDVLEFCSDQFDNHELDNFVKSL
jgi:hypothetical protein